MGQKTQRSICLVFNGDSYPNKGDTGALNEACVLDTHPFCSVRENLQPYFPLSSSSPSSAKSFIIKK